MSFNSLNDVPSMPSAAPAPAPLPLPKKERTITSMITDVANLIFRMYQEAVLAIQCILTGRLYPITLTYDNGFSYYGEVVEEKRHGYGTLTGLDFSYEGDWVKNDRHGQGTMKYTDGAIYTGAWKSNKHEGHGVMIYANKDIYSGLWQNHIRNGNGIMTYQKDGNIETYEGHWENNLRSGYGTMTYANGKAYRGMWEKDQMHGEGVLLLNGKIQQHGTWLNGNFSGNIAYNSTKK